MTSKAHRSRCLAGWLRTRFDRSIPKPGEVRRCDPAFPWKGTIAIAQARSWAWSAWLWFVAGLCIFTVPAAVAAEVVNPPALSARPPQSRLDEALRWMEAGHTQQARSALELLVTEYPNRPEPRVNLAVLLARQGEPAAARAQLEAALHADAAFGHAYDQLRTLHAHMARDAYARAGLVSAPSAEAARPAASGIELQWLPQWTSSAPNAAAASGAAANELPVHPASAPTGKARPAPSPAVSAVSTPAAWERDSQTAELAGSWPRWSLHAAVALIILALGSGTAWAVRKKAQHPADNPPTQPAAMPAASQPAPEQRLIQIYRLIGDLRLPEALNAAEQLAQDEPHFPLGQMVYADLLLANQGQLVGPGAPTAAAGVTPPANVAALRDEAGRRLLALREPPPAGLQPRQFVQLPTSVKHAVAVDAERSRLHVFDHRAGQLVLRASYWVALGSLGVGKRIEGDQRTPLGVYQITTRLEGRQVGDFYGPGALPLNYPNEHDRRLGRTGANIWLHGSPSTAAARGGRATNGCVVLANDDMQQLLRELEPRRTPVVISRKIDWVPATTLSAQRQAARALVDTWRRARAAADVSRLTPLYAQDFDNGETDGPGWLARLKDELARVGARERDIIDLTVLAWQEQGEHLIVDFTEVTPGGGLRPQRRRQYWAAERGQWKIFSEGVFE